ncbi:DUF4365 domain-containing protein [Flavonifractor sp. AGMB03687]|uniref:DUF4365 domain-containing protein n=1 Tax=Flavonifractor sp. AGMB03687 TaxID=2785133 RepID=UPI002473B729|nr:DUF4365 domain-containing protein [Flavonifractor sp. AGMB03687]
MDFWEQTVEDYGIDAHIELCLDGKPTGQLIAAQIKCGDSWFARQNQEGYRFTDEIRHLDYWLSHSLPVILILYNHHTHTAVWTPVEKSRVAIHDKTWSITVPANQVLNRQAKDKLQALVLPHERSAPPQIPSLSCGQGAGRVLNLLAAARERLQIATPWIDAGFLSSLKLLSHQGVETCLLLNSMQPEELRQEIVLVARESPALQIRMRAGLHQELILVDGQTMVTGSANLTETAWRSPLEETLEYAELQRLVRAERQFQKVWRDAVPM